MTHEEVKALVEEMGLPYAYDHFAEGESPDPPFICFLYPKAENFGADNLVYHHFNRLDIEVYTDYKDPDMEANQSHRGAAGLSDRHTLQGFGSANFT